MPDLVFKLIVRDDGSAVVQKFSDNVDDVAKKSQKAAGLISRGFSRLRGTLNRVGKAVFSLRTAFIGLGLIVVARVLRSLIGTFVEFQRAMNRVAALTGATGEVFELLTEQAKELGRTTVFTATQSARAQALFARAGFEVAEIFEGVPKVLDLAAAGQIDLAQATDIVIGAIRGLKIPFEDLTKLNDILAKASASSGVTVTDLGTAFRKVGPIATAVGVTLKDLVAILGTIGDIGVPATEAGTSLRRIIAALVAPTTQARKTLDRLGVSVRDVDGRLRSLTEIFSELSEASDDAQDLFRIFGIRAAVVAEIITTNSVRISELREKLDDAGDTAARIAKVQLRGLVGSLTLMRSAIEAAKISIVEALEPAIINVASSITKFAANVAVAVSAITKMSNETKNVGEQGSFLKEILEALTPSVKTVIFVFFLLRRAFLSVKFILLTITKAFIFFVSTIIPKFIRAIGKLVTDLGVLIKNFAGAAKESAFLSRILDTKTIKSLEDLGKGAEATGESIQKFGREITFFEFQIDKGSVVTRAFATAITFLENAGLSVGKELRKTSGAIQALAESEKRAIDISKELVKEGGLLARASEILGKVLRKALGLDPKPIKDAGNAVRIFGKEIKGLQADIIIFGEKSNAVLSTFAALFKNASVQSVVAVQEAGEQRIAAAEEGAAKELAVEQAKFASISAITGAALGTIAKLTDREGKKAFAIQQAIAVAQAVVSTAVGIARALELGPIAGPIAAAVVAAIGAAQIATIISAKPGAARVGGVGGGGGGGGAQAQPAPGEPVREEAPAAISRQINISVAGFVGDERTLVSELGRVFREAEGDEVGFTLET